MSTGEVQQSAAGGAPAWWGRFRRLLGEQIDAAHSLEHLSQVHSRAVSSGDPDAVLEVLAHREPVIARLAAGAQELEPFMVAKAGAPAKLIDTLAPGLRAEVRAELSRLEQLLDGVSVRDERDRVALGARRAAVADELAGLAVGRSASSAYAPGGTGPGAQGPSFQDRRA